MTSSPSDLAAQLMREALLCSLRREDVTEERVATKLQLIADRLVDKAADGDLPSIKEILDRIDGKSLPGVAVADSKEPAGRIVIWQDYPSDPDTVHDLNFSPSSKDPNASPAS